MFKLLSVISIILVFSATSYANTYKVLKVIGKVQATGKKVKKGQKIKSGETVEGLTPISYVLLRKKGQRIAFKGKFKATLENEIDSKSKEPTKTTVSLIYGSIRARVKNNDATPANFRIKTKAAAAGVRGTDFLVSHVDVLNESQIVCFDGSVDFSKADLSGNQQINKGQWGGVGGRFGKDVAPPLNLSKEALDFFATNIKL